VDHGEEVSAEFFEASSQSAHVFHGAEEALDDVTHFVEAHVMGNRVPGVGFVGDDRQSPFIGNELADCARAVSLVGDDGKRCSGTV